MIVIAGTLNVLAEHRDAFVSAARQVTQATLQEEGCRTFGLWGDLDDAHRFLMYEVWESPDHHAAHLKTPHFLLFRSAREDLGVESAFNRYLVEAPPST
jgi:quinol monooxygenase YgiN